MPKCVIVLLYETNPKPIPLGWTHDSKITVLVKRQLLAEAQEALNGAVASKDDVLVASYQASLDRLQKTLDTLIPPEFEELYVG